VAITAPVAGGIGDTISTLVVGATDVVVMSVVGLVVARSLVDATGPVVVVGPDVVQAQTTTAAAIAVRSFMQSSKSQPRPRQARHTGIVTTAAEITFSRLTAAPFDELVRLLNEPRNARHMPLSEPFTDQEAREWIEGKDGRWDEHGFGPWAIYIDGTFAGWGGFQLEPNGADYGLVLLPEFWGHGDAITVRALEIGFDELGLEEVLIALPPSRNPDRAVGRYGFEPDGEVTYYDVTFRQYRLTRDRWEAGRAQRMRR
jgi:RimJ/RimL family protein N-acetyltransferase